MEVAGGEIWTAERLVYVYLLAVIAPQPFAIPMNGMDRSDFHLLRPLQKQQTDKRYATDADVKQAVITWRSDVAVFYPYVTYVSK
jgi:hypothetical protein